MPPPRIWARTPCLWQASSWIDTPAKPSMKWACSKSHSIRFSPPPNTAFSW
jgi:hypothetical protein